MKYMSSTRVHPLSPKPTSFKATRRKLYLAMLAASQLMVAGQLWASPEGGEVVGGEGVIDQAGTETTIHQTTERMAIDWKSFDVKADERVQFIQPKSTSVALNRVLSHKGSEILGRIDANGQVILINPNGIVFGKDSQINVGGMIASGLSIDPNDFMNGEFTLTAIEGTEGKIINSGIINAATGGSVTLLGKEIKNEGLISAHLGAVNLAAGKAAVVTFDASGLVGVKITQAVLQNDLGLDAAVINGGDINAQGGKILITASVSRDIFSQAVNNGGMNQANSVVMNEDGTFTLGAGANVKNSGTISTSNTNGDAGQIVLLGNNISNSGNILADTNSGAAGHIEINSTDTTELTQTTNISVQAINSGVGGDVKILGNKVGLFDNSIVNASGAHGGGQVLVGGDKTGQNKTIRNADFIYLGENSNVKTDAILNGDGGKLITFASDTARIYGNLSARGGSEGGNGGFVETSGLKGFEILNAPDVGAAVGHGGTWLIDPYDIDIVTGNSNNVNTSASPFVSFGDNAKLKVDTLAKALSNGATVTVQTGVPSVGNTTTELGDITLTASLTYNTSGSGFNNSGATSTLILSAANDIKINNNIVRDNAGTGKLNISLIANSDNIGGGSITIDSVNNRTIETEGGYFYAGVRRDSTEFNATTGALNPNEDGFLNDDMTNPKGVNFTSYTSATDFGTINTTGRTGGGDIFINVTGDAKLGTLIFSHGVNDTNAGAVSFNLTRLGSATIKANNVNLEKELNFNDSGERTRSGISSGSFGSSVEDTFLSITAANNITINQRIYDEYGDSRDALNINLTAGNTLDVNKSVYTSGGNFFAQADIVKSNGFSIDTENANGGDTGQQQAADWSNGGNITIAASTSVNLGGILTDRTATVQANVQGNLLIKRINTATNSTDNVAVTQTTSSAINVFGTSTFDVNSNSNTDVEKSKIDLTNVANVFTKAIAFTNAGNVNLKDTDTTGVDLGASNIAGTFALNAAGDITQSGALVITGITTLTALNKNITLATSANNFGTVNFSSNIGALTLVDTNAVTLGAVTTNGGAITILAEGALSVGALETSVATGKSGDLTLTGKGGITLNGDLKANSATSGAQTRIGGNITLNNNVNLAAGINILASGVVRGDISFVGTVNSADSTPRNLFMTGKAFTFGSDVGFLNPLGILDISATGDVNTLATKPNFSVGNLRVGASTNVYFGAIKTFATAGTGNGGQVDITSSGIINVGAIDTHGVGTGSTGGAVIVLGKNIILNGDVNTKSDAGVDSAATLTLNSAGTVDLSQYTTGAFSSVLTIAGSAGVDTLKGQNFVNSWAIGGANNTVGTNIFSVIENIIGAATQINTFTLVGDGGVTDITGGNLADTFSLNTATNFAVNLNGGAGNDSFTLNAKTTGLINGDGDDDSFSISANAGTINGGAGNDIFTLTNAVSATSLNGGGNADTLIGSNNMNDWLISAAGAGTVTSSAKAVNFLGMETLSGGSASDTLTGADVANTWALTGNKSGTLNASFNFDEMDILNGGSGVDTFTTSAVFTGTLKGNAGADIFNLNHTVTGATGVNGGAGADTFNVNAAGLNITLFGGTNTATEADVIKGPNAANSWQLTGANAGKLITNIMDEVIFSEIETLTGGTGTDTLTANIGTNNWLITSNTAGSINALINFSAMENVNGNTGVDTFTPKLAYKTIFPLSLCA
jgi:filamentous hemagglutinin family protein